jgi:archaellum biogenesis ATPase FlaH
MAIETKTMTNSDFLAEVLGPLEQGQHGWVTSFRADPGNAPPTVWSGRNYKGSPAQAAVIDRAHDDNAYFCTAVLGATEDGEVVRRKDAFIRLAALVVDDVNPADIQAFSWSMQTSPGNHQVGILLDCDDPDTYNRQLIDRVMSSLAARGRTNDASGNACVRYVRLPEGTNTKPRAAGPWKVQLDIWAPRVRWSLADACAAVGIDLEGLHVQAQVAKVAGTPGTGTHAGEMVSGMTGPINERNYHDSIVRLAASLVAGGMYAGAAVEFLYSLMDANKPVHDEEEMRRWQIRRGEIPRAVKSAEKFAPEERRPPQITVNLNMAASSSDEPSSPGEPLPMDWLALSASPPEPTQWRLDGWLPERTVTLLSANGGVGKSNLSLQLAISLVLGHDFLNIKTKPSRVLVISAEDEARTVHFRVANICKDMSVDMSQLTDLAAYDLTQEDCVMWKDGHATERMQWLADKTVRHKADVVIIDNVSDVFLANENDRAEVRGFMRCLSMISSSTGCAVLLLAHVDKASVRTTAGSDSNTTFSGSTAWNNSARSRWAMVREADTVTLRHEKCNLGPLQEELQLEFDAGSKTFKHFGTIPGQKAAQVVVRNAHRAVILKLIGRATAAGTNLSMASDSPRYNIFNVLKKDPEFAKNLESKTFFDIMRDLEREGLIALQTYTKANRMSGQRVILTDQGQTRVALGSGAGPTWAQREDE